jgi:hypothetical protein
VLDVPDSNTNGFLSRDTCVSLTQLHRPILNQESLLHLEKPKLQKLFLSEMNTVLTCK